MWNGFKQQRGLSMVEAMLVLVILSGIIIMGIRGYQAFQRDADALTLRGNVDILAQAAANYYYANCYGFEDANTDTFIPGTLHPDSNPSSPFLLNIITQLKAPGYLPTVIKYNPIAAMPTANTPESGYLVQFRRYDAPRYACLTSSCTGAGRVQVGTTVAWRIEVGVRLRNTAQSGNLKNITGASCATNLSGSTMQSCAVSTGGNGKSYLLFDRSPSQPTSVPAAMWQNNPIMMQNTLFYRTNPISYSVSSGNQQYFLCSS